MTPQEKCVSLETAQKLKVAGFPQDTERYWVREEHKEPHLIEFASNVYENWAAPDAQEIWDLLPYAVNIDESRYWLSVLKDVRNGCWVSYCKEKCDPADADNCEGNVWSINEAEARAACWLWLKENNLL